ncbi:MAG: Threonine efflux protein [Candidatus Erwinia impunctatus]|nr:Threonine efflux protein [Culicoides impunctatus]
MTELISVITLTLLAVISPGPDFAMVTRNSLLLSHRAGILTAAGIGTGVLVHVTYTLIGVGILLQHAAALFTIIKYLGALYLVWLGIKMLRARDVAVSALAGAPVTDSAAFRVGFFTNVLNPKTMVFIISLFMQVIDSHTPLWQQIMYGGFISLMHILWFSLVALCFSAGVLRQRLLGMRLWLDRLFGGLLVVFGVLLTLSQHSR